MKGTAGERAFADVLREVRRRTGITQEALAERCGLSSRGISDLERGVRRAPHRSTVDLLLSGLGLGAEERQKLIDAAAASRGRGRLPPAGAHPTSTLIGRERELAELDDLLRHPGNRLLTLSGPAGVGKSRLALEAFRSVQRAIDAAHLIDLTPIGDPAQVLDVIAATIGAEPGADGPVAAVAGALSGRRVLLLLDNFEHVVDARIDLAKVLTVAPGLQLLVTSRRRLRIVTEREVAVSPLRLPQPGVPAGLEAMAAVPAVQLFVECAGRADPGFRLTPDNAGCVAALCSHLDGLPLAIELAAARAPVLPPNALVRRLDDLLDLLAAGAEDVPLRHRSLAAAYAAGHVLLDPIEQCVFRRLGAFSGGCTLGAAEAVCGLPPATLVDALAGLIDASLLLSETGRDGETRFRMLETVNRYARALLRSAGEEQAVRRRHGEWYLDLVASLAPAGGFFDRIASGVLEEEQHNLRAALDWFRGEGEATCALEVADLLLHWWDHRRGS